MRKSRGNQVGVPGLESLESRLLLSGTVTVLAQGANLLIKGDAAANDVEISQVAGGYIVKDTGALDGAVDTIINGVLGGNDTPFAATGWVKVLLGQGNNKVLLTDVSVGGAGTSADLTISGLNGNDSVQLQGVSAAKLNVDLGHGDNSFSVSQGAGSAASAFSGDVTVSAGKGADVINVLGTAIDGSLTVKVGDAQRGGGKGQAKVVLSNTVTIGPEDIVLSRIKGALTVNGGMGNDSVTLAGDATVGAEQVMRVDGAVKIDLKKGDNTLGLSLLSVGGNLTYLGGAGVDALTIASLSVAGKTGIDVKDGADVVGIDDSDFAGRFSLKTGKGNDTVTIDTLVTAVNLARPTEFTDVVVIDMGAGDDTAQVGADVFPAGDVNRAALFDAAVKFIGGTGTDSLAGTPSATRLNVFAIQGVLTGVENLT